jgi:hypothetical protein
MMKLKDETDFAISHCSQARTTHGSQLFPRQLNPTTRRKVQRPHAVKKRALSCP